VQQFTHLGEIRGSCIEGIVLVLMVGLGVAALTSMALTLIVMVALKVLGLVRGGGGGSVGLLRLMRCKFHC